MHAPNPVFKSMRTAFLADIHANREAFAAVMADVKSRGVDQIVFLGDIVGYGADPEWCVDQVMLECSKGAIAVLGNHDAAVANVRDQMSVNAQITLNWTRGQLGQDTREFLAALPMEEKRGTHLYVHADASAPAKWNYVMDSNDAARSLLNTAAWLTCVGHVHRPAIYAIATTGKLTHFVPVTNAPVPLLPQRRWIVVVGSVGQPRDGNPAAAYSIYDRATNEITSIRVAYDIDAAAEKIRKAGFPDPLARRLKTGH